MPSVWRRVRADPADWFTASELDRARRYQRPLTGLRILRGALGVGLLVVFAGAQLGPGLLGALGWDTSSWVVQLVVLIVALELLALGYDLPLDAWVDLRHDRRWGLSTQTARGLAADEAKSFVLSLVVTPALLVPLYWLVRSTELWWLWGWLLVVGFGVGLGFVFPVVVAPLFNRFEPLRDEELEDRLREVARRAGVEVAGIEVADESRRSTRDNAYVAGLGPTRRVVVFDTLLEHPPEIVEQVVAHELGHWRRHHLRRQIPMVAAVTFVVFLGLRALAGWDGIFAWAGAEGIGDPLGLPVVLLGVQVGFGVVGLVLAAVSRAFEREADLEALEILGAPERMTEMHRALHVKNLADLDPGLPTRLRATHPPAAERLEITRRWARAREADSPTIGGPAPDV